MIIGMFAGHCAIPLTFAILAHYVIAEQVVFNGSVAIVNNERIYLLICLPRFIMRPELGSSLAGLDWTIRKRVGRERFKMTFQLHSKLDTFQEQGPLRVRCQSGRLFVTQRLSHDCSDTSASHSRSPTLKIIA